MRRLPKIVGISAGGYWPEITRWSEFDDFRKDGMGQTRPRGKGQRRHGSCLHVTFQYVDPIHANWTYRPRSDSKC
ncbi:MAG: hypothetical protein JWM47_584 [Acidimicrobiales bacterium]|nr:hypothetical protein [Acidimicrobiales bacterium]